MTEGTSNNAYIVKGNAIITRHLGTEILHGITRAAVLRFAREAQMQVEERPFTIEEAQGADEAFITSASAFVMPVVEIDGTAIGDGRPGTVTARLREVYLDEMRKAAILSGAVPSPSAPGFVFLSTPSAPMGARGFHPLALPRVFLER